MRYTVTRLAAALVLLAGLLLSHAIVATPARAADDVVLTDDPLDSSNGDTSPDPSPTQAEDSSGDGPTCTGACDPSSSEQEEPPSDSTDGPTCTGTCDPSSSEQEQPPPDPTDGPTCTGTCDPPSGEQEEPPDWSFEDPAWFYKDADASRETDSTQTTDSTQSTDSSKQGDSSQQPASLDDDYQQCLTDSAASQTSCQNRGNTACSVLGAVYGTQLGGPAGAGVGGAMYGVCDAIYGYACADAYQANVAACGRQRDCLAKGGTDCDGTWARIKDGGSYLTPWPKK